MSTNDLTQLVIAVTALIAAVSSIISIIRQQTIKTAVVDTKATVDHTLQVTNGHNQELRQLVQSQAEDMHKVGLAALAQKIDAPAVNNDQ